MCVLRRSGWSRRKAPSCRSWWSWPTTRRASCGGPASTPPSASSPSSTKVRRRARSAAMWSLDRDVFAQPRGGRSTARRSLNRDAVAQPRGGRSATTWAFGRTELAQPRCARSVKRVIVPIPLKSRNVDFRATMDHLDYSITISV